MIQTPHHSAAGPVRPVADSLRPAGTAATPSVAAGVADSLPAADSLPVHGGYCHVAPIFRKMSEITADSVGGDTLPEEASLPFPLCMEAMPSHLRMVGSQQMFGTSSVKASFPREVASGRISVADDGLFQSLTLAVLFFGIMLVAGYKREIATLSGKLLRGRLWEDYASGRRRETVPRRFMALSLVVVFMLAVLLPVKYSTLWLPSGMFRSSSWFTATALLMAAVAVVAVAAYEIVALHVAGYVTRRRDVTDGLLYLKGAYLAETAAFTAPVLMMSILSLRGMLNFWGVLLTVECAILSLLFIKETFAFFVGKKIPIFHWFLYLCTVEVFPLSLIWALALRSQ